jgi:hypothetical protein
MRIEQVNQAKNTFQNTHFSVSKFYAFSFFVKFILLHGGNFYSAGIYKHGIERIMASQRCPYSILWNS